MIGEPLKQDQISGPVTRIALCDSPRVSVVIPHFYPGREKNVERLVEGLKRQTFDQVEILIVRSISPQGRAINEGTRRALGSILIVMDDDTQLDQPFLVENLVRVLDSDPRIAMAGASVVSPQDINSFQRAAGKQFPRFNMPVVQEATDSDMACHGCVAFRRDIFEQVGREREDILRGLDPDLRVRIRKAGYRVVLAPNTWVYHPLPASPLKFLQLFYRNGAGAAYTQVFHPEINYDTSEALNAEKFVSKRSFAYRIFRFPLRLLGSLFAFQGIRFLGYLAYFFGYAAGYSRYSFEKYRKKAPRFGIALVSILMLAASIFYLNAGHQLIRNIFEGKSLAFLNSFIQGQDQFDLTTYYDTADGFFLTFLIFGFLLIFILARIHFKKPFTERGGWIFASFLCFGIVTLMYGRPFLGENETAYLIHPLQLAQPGFLRHDWTWQRAAYGHFLFDLTASALLVFLSPLQAALAGRLLVWTFLIGGMARLARKMGPSWPCFAAGFAFWLLADQSLAAGEWIFHGFEAKCVSYVFLFAALSFAFEEKFVKAGIAGGLAIAFHSVVGAWGSIALLSLIAFAVRRPIFKNSFQFCLFAFLLALPGLLPLAGYMSGSGAMTKQNYALDVLFRGTHHMDPASFLSAETGIRILIYLGLAIFFIWKSFPRENAKKLFVFLGSLSFIFGLGLWARKIEWLQFLYIYPFRLGPVFLLLFFSWGAFHFLQKGPRNLFSVFLTAFLIFEMFHFEMPKKIFKGSGHFYASWKGHLLGRDRDDFDRIADWIRKNTPEESVFIAPPWEYRFWISARRAQVVSYKYVHVNASNEKWLERIRDLNGGRPFESTGGAVLKELQENFPKLSLSRLLEFKEKYQADYYLTVRRRDDLPFKLVFANRSYFLYRLS